VLSTEVAVVSPGSHILHDGKFHNHGALLYVVGISLPVGWITDRDVAAPSIATLRIWIPGNRRVGTEVPYPVELVPTCENCRGAQNRPDEWLAWLWVLQDVL